MSLKICIPVSQSDIDLLGPLTEVMVGLGGLEPHDIQIFPTPSVEEAAARITEPLKAICASYACTSIGYDPEGGWPYAPNFHFGKMVEKLEKMGNDKPWLNMEADCTPQTPSWADDLLTEHNLNRKAFTGFIRNTSEVWPEEEGRHMVGGCAIYPPDFDKWTSMWQFPHKTQPYDVYMRWVIVGNDKVQHAHHTSLIQHLRRTEQYQEEGDSIICRDCQPDNAPADWTCRTHTVSKDAVLIHGCRDSSLARIVLRALGKTAPDPTIEEKKAVADKKASDNDIFERVKAALGTEKATLKALSETLGVDKTTLRAALESESSPFVVRPPILWVSLREPAPTA